MGVLPVFPEPHDSPWPPPHNNVVLPPTRPHLPPESSPSLDSTACACAVRAPPGRLTITVCAVPRRWSTLVPTSALGRYLSPAQSTARCASAPAPNQPQILSKCRPLYQNRVWCDADGRRRVGDVTRGGFLFGQVAPTTGLGSRCRGRLGPKPPAQGTGPAPLSD